MTDHTELRRLHEKWLIGTDNDAEAAQEAVMEVHFIALLDEVDGLKAENKSLREALETDRYKVAIAINAIDRSLKGREWMLEGRGPYEWDDDQYRAEFHSAAEEIREAFKPLLRVAKDWDNCPTDPDVIRECGERARAAMESST